MCPKELLKVGAGGELRRYAPCCSGPFPFFLPRKVAAVATNGHLWSLRMRLTPSDWQGRNLEGPESLINLLSQHVAFELPTAESLLGERKINPFQF